jgi:hypothetical protein
MKLADIIAFIISLIGDFITFGAVLMAIYLTLETIL